MTEQTVLVTGANGYVGLHVVNQCLTKGWDVVGVVRSEKAANRLRSIFPTATEASQLSVAFVTDISTPDHFKPAFNVEGHSQVTAVINTASPLINNPQDIRREVLNPAIQSATALLEAVQRFGPSVQRVVHTSSCGAVLDPVAGLAPGKTYTAEDWNPVTYEGAVEGGPGLAYLGSKVLAERALWAWMADHEAATFDLVSIAPAGLIGPHYFGALDGKETLDLEHLNLSSQMLWVLISPTATRTSFSEPFHLGCWADVRDAAAAQVAAVATPAASGKRLLCAQRCHWQLVRDVSRRAMPELKDRIDVGTPGAFEAARDTTYDIDGSAFTKVLGLEYTPIETAVRDTYVQLVEAESKPKE
ncbi:hypothetical protein QQZ08_008577 [Neonectria magnoliae]|uniref:NAD-dependent epimerase/dehydratase domain-containing protein n=1 Tax=Neonectria magnoliae TaxID=2732573 RepID=A0ABR1HUC6_9HYPO